MNEIQLYNQEAEQSVLGSILIDKDCLIEVGDILNKDDFYINNNIIIYEVLTNMQKKNIPIDLITLKEELENKKELEKIGGISYLTELTEIVPTTANIVAYSKIIKNFSIKRKIKALLNNINGKLETEESDLLIPSIYSGLDKIEEGTISSEDNMFTLLSSTLDYIELIKKSDLIGFSFGSQFKWLDKLTGGIQRGKIYRIGGPSNVGKSWLLYNFLISLLSQTDNITFFSLENSKLDILKNFFGLKRGVNTLPAFIKENNYDFTDEALWFENKKNFKLSNEKNIDNIARIALKNKSHFIFIDYIQLLQVNGTYSDVARAEAIAKRLQDIASKYNVGIIDLSQVSNSTKSGGLEGSGADELKGASAYKETSDIVLHIGSDTNKELAKQSAISNGEKDKLFTIYNKVKVTKNRLGPGVGSIRDFSLDFNLGGKYILEDFNG